MTGLDKYITVDGQLLAEAPVVEAPAPPAATATPVATATPTAPTDTDGREEPSDQPEPTDQPTEDQTVAATPTVETEPVFSRPPTGVIQPNVTNSGCGQFEVENGTDSDGVVALMLGEQAVTAVYVRAGENAFVDGVGDGVYQIYFTTGNDWGR